MKLRLWHDDVRPPPDDSWEWARTNEAAMAFLKTGKFTECSLDHDLGLHGLGIEETEDWDKIIEITYALADTIGEETGVDLVKWMIDTENVPARVTIHSWNPEGAARMAEYLAEAGYDCYLAPFRPPQR